MTELPGHDEGIEPDEDAPSIGVGMGGSCPQCRAPVDLGQEFCLECGAPIRFTAKQRRSKNSDSRQRPTAAAAPGKSFPWVPFLVVLVLVLGGLGFALASGNDGDTKGSSKDTTEEALPQITNQTPTSTTATETVSDCADADPFAPDDASDGFIGTETGSDAEIPQIDAGSPDEQAAGTPDASTDSNTPATTSDDDPDSAATVTVDESGNLCGAGGDADTGDTVSPSTGTEPASTSPNPATNRSSTTPPTSTTADDGSWPAGKSGWTVVVNGDAGSEQRANQISTDVQAKQLDAGVLKSDDFVSLCPGNWVVFSGVLDTEAAAKQQQAKVVAAGFRQAYIREVRTTGSKPSCVSSGARP